ncbi:hypothetical protein [Microbacterium paludicola]|uniref:hypothetical protein n=1 Tax=Microbacterium paludicola TaxID=300019 RepID=UPI0011A71876|nr:hypothetical protein [Microbacterium paludicola]
MPPEVQGFLSGVTLADVLTWVGVLGAIFAAFKWVIPLGRKVSHFIDDVAGEPARPGVPARPGLMERVTAIETTQEAQSGVLAEHSKTLATVNHEVTTNHGSSLKDAVKSVQSKVDDVASWQEKHEKRSDTIVQRIDGIEKHIKENV